MSTRERGPHGDRRGPGAGAGVPTSIGAGTHSGRPRSGIERIGKAMTGYTGASASVLPTKLYFRIGEVAGALGVETHVLRYWETEFRSIRPQKSSRGQRVYSRRDVDTLMRIKELLYERGFTIAGARKQLRDGGIEPREPADPTLRGANRMRAALLEIRLDVVRLLETLRDDT